MYFIIVIISNWYTTLYLECTKNKIASERSRKRSQQSLTVEKSKEIPVRFEDKGALVFRNNVPTLTSNKKDPQYG